MNTSRFDCNKIELSLDAYHDDELDTAEYHMVRDHLNICAKCAKKSDQIRHTVSALKNLPRLSMVKDMSADLDNLLKKNSQKTKVKYQILGGAVGIAAVIASWVMASFYPQMSTLQVAHMQSVYPDNSVHTLTGERRILSMDNLGRQKPIHLLPLRPVRLRHKPKHSFKVEKENLFANDVQVANVFGSDQNCISETLGCTTDEDGLYALKM